jgi:hypothetical protein
MKSMGKISNFSGQIFRVFIQRKLKQGTKEDGITHKPTTTQNDWTKKKNNNQSSFRKSGKKIMNFIIALLCFFARFENLQ